MRVETNDQVVEKLRTRTALALLVFLILNRYRTHTRDELVERFWNGDDPESARQKLRLALYSIRQEFPELLSSDRFTTRVNQPDAVWCDYEEVVLGIAEARRDSGAGQLPALEKAAELCTGGLMHGYYEDWVLEERARAELDAAWALAELIRHYSHGARWADVVRAAQLLITLDPYSETAHLSLLQALSTLGRNSSVARHLKWVRDRFAEIGREVPTDLLAFKRKRGDREQEPEEPVFIGREVELAQLLERAKPGRILTLHGPAGIGKSRLAREVFHGIQDQGESTVYVALATAKSAQQVEAAVRAAISPSDPSAGTLSEMIESLAATTLILDNLEQVVEAAGVLVANWIRINPDLQILATSQIRLGIEGEEVFEVQPLDLPSPHGTAAQIGASSSARLLVERVALFGGRLVIDRSSAKSIALLCQELEGNPLALELASEWLRVLSPNDVLRRYRGTVKSLSTRSTFHETRHRSLEAAIGASFELLSEPIANFLCELSIFAGGWSLAAAEAVCEGDDVAAMLAELHERSLIVVDTSKGRYRMLESIHSYARERLPSEKEAVLLRKMADYFVRWAREITENEQDNVAVKLYDDNENIRQVIDTLSEIEEDGARFALSCAEFGWFWSKTAQYDEARRRMLTALDRMPTEPSPLRARILNWVGCIAYFQCDYAEAEKWFLARAEVLERLGDEVGVARSAGNLAINRNAAGDWAGALQLSRKSYAAIPASLPTKEVVVFTHNHGDILLNNGHVEEGIKLVRETLDISVQNDFVAMIGLGCLVMGEHLLHTGREADAEPYLRRAVEALVQVEEPLRIIAARAHLATLYATTGRRDEAAREIRESLDLLPRIGGALPLAQCAEAAAALALASGACESAYALFEAGKGWRNRGAMAITPLHETFLNAMGSRIAERLTPVAINQAEVRGKTWTRSDLLEAIREFAA